MKGKIALFTNGYTDKCLAEAIDGICEIAAKNDVDVFHFMSYASVNEAPGNYVGELNIYSLPHIEDFDGIIVFASMINSPETVDELRDKAFDYNIPIVNIGAEIEGVDTVLIDNEGGTAELVNHLITAHGAKDFVIIAGPTSNIDAAKRLKASKDTIAAAGLTLKDSDIYICDWSQEHASNIAEEIYSKRDRLPDAIVCANDNIAMAVCATLMNHGVSIPGDVKVTGFDYTPNAQIFYPSIATVKQDFRSIGLTAAKHLFDIMEHASKEDTIIVPAGFIPGESCGCLSEKSNSVRLSFCQNTFLNYVTDNKSEWHLEGIADGLSFCQRVEDIYLNVENIFNDDHEYEGSSFGILLDKGYINSIKNGGNPTRIDGYSSDMDVLFCIDEEVIQRPEIFKSRELVPNYKKVEGKSNLYTFIPMHIKEFVYGYMYFKNTTAGIADRTFRTYANRFVQLLERLKQSLKLDLANRKLEDLYIKDQLTGLLNRHGMDKFGLPYFNQTISNGSSAVIMFIDINSMKIINDKYGHIQGDVALTTVSNVISNVIDPSWISVRYGGDEFLIIGELKETIEASRIQKTLVQKVQKIGRDLKLPYPLSVSVGYVITDPKDHLSLEAYVKQADELMYAIKREIHNQ